MSLSFVNSDLVKNKTLEWERKWLRSPSMARHPTRNIRNYLHVVQIGIQIVVAVGIVLVGFISVLKALKQRLTALGGSNAIGIALEQQQRNLKLFKVLVNPAHGLKKFGRETSRAILMAKSIGC